MIDPAMDSAVPAENASRFQQALGKPSGFPTDSTATTTTRYSGCLPNRHGSVRDFFVSSCFWVGGRLCAFSVRSVPLWVR